MKALQILFVALLAVFIVAPAMAIDMGACGNDFVYNDDSNVICIGRLELQDMGQFDTNGNWQWDQAFFEGYIGNSYTQYGPDNNGIAEPVLNNNSGPVFNYGRLDNRAFPESRDRDPDSRFVFNGDWVESNGYLIPSIWVFNVTNSGITYDPDTCPEGPFAPPYTAYCDYVTTFPGDTDPAGGGPCYDINSSIGCSPIYNGLIALDPNAEFPTTSYYMDTEGQSPDGAPIMISVGNNNVTPIVLEDIASVTWIEGNQTRAPYYTENANYYYIGFDMGINQVNTNGDFTYDPNQIYFQPFEGQVPVGQHTLVVNFVNGQSLTINAEITSNTLMPVVEAKSYYTDIVATKVNKSGKIIKATETQVEADNLKAKVIINDNGEEALLIQFAEPDRAMELTNPQYQVAYLGC